LSRRAPVRATSEVLRVTKVMFLTFACKSPQSTGRIQDGA